MLSLLSVIVAAVLVLLTSASARVEKCGRAPAMRRVAGLLSGEDVRPYQYPWIVAVQRNGSHYCSGAVVRKSFVLTAADCFRGGDSEVTVVAGRYELSSAAGKGDRINGTVVVHPDFRGDFHNDIALVRLHSPLRFGRKIQPICLPEPTEPFQLGDAVSVTRWAQMNAIGRGAATRSGFFETNRLLKQREFVMGAQVNCTDRLDRYLKSVKDACSSRSRRNPKPWCAQAAGRDLATAVERSKGSGDTDRLCTMTADGDTLSDAVCYGDSGSPLMRRLRSNSWSVVGISSHVTPICDAAVSGLVSQFSGYYTNVLHHIDWIQSIVNVDSIRK